MVPPHSLAVGHRVADFLSLLLTFKIVSQFGEQSLDMSYSFMNLVGIKDLESIVDETLTRLVSLIENVGFRV